MKFASRLKQAASALSSTTLSVGTVVTLGAAAAMCRTLAQVISDGASDPTAIKVGDTNIPFAFDDGSNWMDAYCTITSTTQITITQIDAGSSGPGVAVTFSGQMPNVFNTVFGSTMRRIPVDTFPAAFSTTVPLTQIGTAHMPRQQVSGNLTFTAAANAFKGACAEYPLILDGTSTLTFTGFSEHGSSAGVLNTQGMPNTIWFWYDGYTYWWSASQAAVPVAIDTTAPTMASAAVVNATPSTVTLTASEALDAAFVPAASAFTVSGHTVLAVTSVSGTSVTLSVSAAFVNGEAARTAAYTQPGSNGLRDTAGNLMASFSNLAITNNVQPVDTAAPAFSSAQVASGAPTQIVITLNETLANSTPPNSAFAASGGKSVTGVAVNGTTCTVTVDSAYVNGDVITVSYTQPGANPRLQDAAGNPTASYTNYSVTNNIAVADTQAPTFSSAQVADASPTVVQLTMSEALAASAPPASAFSITEGGNAKTVSSVSVNGAVVSITCSAAFTNGTAIQLTYTQPGANPRLQDAAGNLTATFGPVTVTNNVAAAGASYPRLNPTSRSATVSETTTSPYTYVGTAGKTISNEAGGVTTVSLPNLGEGWIEVQVMNIGDASSGVEIGFRTFDGPAVYTSQQGNGLYTSGQNGALPAGYRMTGAGTTGPAPQANDVLRFSRELIAGVWTTKGYVRTGGGATLSQIFSSTTSVPTAQAWFNVVPYGNATVKLLATSGAA